MNARVKKWWLIAIASTACLFFTVQANPKKATYVKPVKRPKSIMDEFVGLSSEDREFIRDLDRQYSRYGGGVKFKIQRDNSSTSGTNTKRTIDGDLGYGYYNAPHNGYYFIQPRIIYDGPSHHQPQSYGPPSHPVQEIVSEIEVQQSHSYQLPTTVERYPATGHPSGYEQVQEPVIILKIPTKDAKYASHLQNLLQQYLELKAAQYLQAIHEQEASYAHHHQASPLIHYYPSHMAVAYSQPVYHPAPASGPAAYPEQEQAYYHQSGHYHQSDHYHQEEHVEPQLKTYENYPSDSHTKVIFKDDIQHYGYDHSSPAPPPVVQITQRSRTVQHHSHGPKYGSKRDVTPPFTEDQFKKYNKIIQQLKKTSDMQKA